MSTDIYEEIVRLRAEEIPAALATVVDTKGSTPGKLGARMIVMADGSIVGTIGGGCVEADVIRTARSVLDTGCSEKMQFTLAGEDADRTGLACGGKVEVMIEPLNEPHLFMLGAGHVGQKIAALAKACGFRVTVIDDRPDYCSKDRFPDADECAVVEFGSLEEVGVGPTGFVVIATRGHQHDYDTLLWALGTKARFVGLLGSRSKRLQFERRLEADGISADTLTEFDCPVGLSIGAETPDEIAVSIVAALVARRRLNEPLS